MSVLLPPREAADPYCLNEGESAALLAGHPWRRFVVLGDSVAAGVGDPVDGYSPLPWCDRVAAELGAAHELAYLNLGRRELLAAEVRAEQLDPALAFRPDLALVACGGNDALRSSYRADQVDDELIAIITGLRDIGATVITIGMFDVSYAPAFPSAVKRVVSARMRRLSEHTATLGERLGTVHVDVTGHPAERDVESYSADGLHGNLRSHAICAAATVRRLGRHVHL